MEKIVVLYPYPFLFKRGKYKMCKAILISEAVINRCLEDNIPLNTSKLQKVLYYMQKEHLVRYDSPVFDEKILAWACGPAINEVYEHFKSGRLGFQEKVEQGTILLKTHQEVLNVVLNKYGKLQPIDMMQISQEETCWKTVWNNGLGNNDEIPLTKIKESAMMEET